MRQDSYNVIQKNGLHKYYNLVKGLQAGLFCLAGRFRSAGGRLPKPVLDTSKYYTRCLCNNRFIKTVEAS